MNYIGSKASLLDFLEQSMEKVVDKKGGVFCDLFAGTGAVGSHFKKKGYKVIANDIQYYSYVLNRHYIGNHKNMAFSGLVREIPALKSVGVAARKDHVCAHLSALEGKKGFIYSNYCLGGTKAEALPRQYFSDENGMACDAIRQTIENWKGKGLISDNEYYFLVATLVESIDKYANTASVYGAFLKNLKRTARARLVLNPADLILNDQKHQVYNADVNQIIGRISGDILYLDPPYNHRQYATNYHLLETIAKYDSPEIRGKTGLREYQRQKSLYCSKTQVKEAFRDLIRKAKFAYVFLSYNNESLMRPDDIREIMSLRGEYGRFAKKHSRFKADKDGSRNHKASETVEYLHYVICRGQRR